LDLGFAEDLVPEVAAKIRRSPQIHLAADQFGELALDPGDLDQPNAVVRLEFDKEVHVAARLVLPRRVEPKSESFRICRRLQKSASSSRETSRVRVWAMVRLPRGEYRILTGSSAHLSG
jgi:hypothetical protein